MNLEVGMEAPAFELSDQNGKLWRLEDLKGTKVVLYFYPIDDTPGCTRESCDFRDHHEDFLSAGCTVLGISPQDAESHQAFAGKFSLPFPLLVDEDMETADAYGVRADEIELFEGQPILIRRSTFVIDEDGRIASAQYGVSSKGHVERLRRELTRHATE